MVRGGLIRPMYLRIMAYIRQVTKKIEKVGVGTVPSEEVQTPEEVNRPLPQPAFRSTYDSMCVESMVSSLRPSPLAEPRGSGRIQEIYDSMYER